MNAEEWIASYAEKLGVRAPSAEQVQQLLAVAGIAAHTSERQAAPVSCWVAAAAGASTEQALRAARELEREERQRGE
ncbi:MAG: DUF6457 domain-containing protein [Solirubrobacteraceae bacterium]